MADGIHPSCNRVKPAHRDAMLYRTLAQPEVHELPPSHNPMLFLREPRDLTVNPRSPSRPTYIGGGDVLGGHAATVPHLALRVVRSV